MPPEVPSRQLTLFGTAPRPLPANESTPGDPNGPASGDAFTAGTDTGQIDLFADRAVLARDLDDALNGGRFEEARRLRSALEETYGPSAQARDLAFLDRLAGDLWERPPAEALSVWAEIDRALHERRALRALLREGVFTRLLESRPPEALVEARPDCLPALCLVLVSGRAARPEEGRRRARALVRDALLAGRPLESLDFRHDADLAELLAEDEPPRWLASLGVIRRLWPVPRSGGTEPEGFRAAPGEPGSDEEAALNFWDCLTVAETADCPEALLHEARRRMKRLRPDLHALYMRRPGTR